MTADRTQRLSRRDRIRDRRDFQRVSREGMRVTTQCFLVLVSGTYPPGGAMPTRLGTTVSRRVGDSVVRNRVKRRIREWFRRSRDLLPDARDVVVIARTGAADLSYASLIEQLGDAARRIRTRLEAKRVPQS